MIMNQRDPVLGWLYWANIFLEGLKSSRGNTGRCSWCIGRNSNRVLPNTESEALTTRTHNRFLRIYNDNISLEIKTLVNAVGSTTLKWRFQMQLRIPLFDVISVEITYKYTHCKWFKYLITVPHVKERYFVFFCWRSIFSESLEIPCFSIHKRFVRYNSKI
jgi:hypothetical protein